MNEDTLGKRVARRLLKLPTALTPQQRAVLDKYQIPPAHVAPGASWLSIGNLPDGVSVDDVWDELLAAGLLVGDGGLKCYVGLSPDDWDES